MTAEERHALRAAIDGAKRQRLATVSEFEARRRRLYAACAKDSTVRRSNQVRAVMRMLDQAAQRNAKGGAGANLDGRSAGAAKEEH